MTTAAPNDIDAPIAEGCATLVPQIIAAHQAIGTAFSQGYRNSLDHAIECGRLLTLAKETLAKDKAKIGWEKWLAENFTFTDGCEFTNENRSIPQSTACLYMRLYTNRDFVRHQAEQKWTCNALQIAEAPSIRQANEWIKAKAYVERNQKRTPAQREEIKARMEKMAAAQVEKAKARAAAEAEAVTTEAARSPSWLKVTLKKAVADDVFEAITETWPPEEITKLGDLCRQHHSAKNAMAA